MEDTVPQICPVFQVFMFAILFVRALCIAAVHCSEQVRVLEIYQSNNDVDVNPNLS